jgi:hypothetical protein
MFTGTRHYEVDVNDGIDEFGIQYTWNSGRGHYVMYCHDHPNDPYQKGVSECHLYSDGKLCQREGYESRTFEDAEAWVYWWMERYSEYVRSGHFPMTVGSYDVD